MKRFCIDLTRKELEDLRIIVDACYATFDFHGDMMKMKKPLDKLSKEIEK